jgi:hypothetical protein
LHLLREVLQILLRILAGALDVALLALDLGLQLRARRVAQHAAALFEIARP